MRFPHIFYSTIRKSRLSMKTHNLSSLKLFSFASVISPHKPLDRSKKSRSPLFAEDTSSSLFSRHFPNFKQFKNTSFDTNMVFHFNSVNRLAVGLELHKIWGKSCTSKFSLLQRHSILSAIQVPFFKGCATDAAHYLFDQAYNDYIHVCECALSCLLLHIIIQFSHICVNSKGVLEHSAPAAVPFTDRHTFSMHCHNWS